MSNSCDYAAFLFLEKSCRIIIFKNSLITDGSILISSVMTPVKIAFPSIPSVLSALRCWNCIGGDLTPLGGNSKLIRVLNECATNINEALHGGGDTGFLVPGVWVF